MDNQFSRTELLFGKSATEKLATSRVAVFGMGGVGGYAVEALARAGVGALDLFDSDTICLSNLNRQIHATHKTIGQYKVDAAAERIGEINPAAIVTRHRLFYCPKTSPLIDLSVYDYIIDAIDTIPCKLELVLRAAEKNTPLLSCMGAGNKLNPAAFIVADIYETSVCPVAKIMRNELRKRGIEKLKVVYSKEPPLTPLYKEETDHPSHNGSARRQTPGSNSFVPPAAGLLLAGEVILSLISRK